MLDLNELKAIVDKLVADGHGELPVFVIDRNNIGDPWDGWVTPTVLNENYDGEIVTRLNDGDTFISISPS